MNEEQFRNIFENLGNGGFGGFTQNIQQQCPRDYRMKIYLGSAIVQEQTFSLIEPQAYQQFRNMWMQVGHSPQPLKCIIEYDYYKWDGSILFVDKIEYENQTFVKGSKGE